MKKLFLSISLLLLLLILLLIFFVLKQPTAEIDNHAFVIDIARSSQEQEIGLAKYNSLPANKGMYFPFSAPAFYAFWMKNMHFPIDIIFIRNSRIITIFHSIPAPFKNQINLPTYQPSAPADSVLEINAGLSQKYGFKAGDKIYLHL